MAIATERFTERKTTQTLDGNWTATRAWDVVGYADENDAVAATTVQSGDAHPLTTGLTCKSIGLTENKFSKGIVTAQYGVVTIADNPVVAILRPPFLNWRWGKQSVQVDTDVFGNPIVNSALDAFGSNGSRNLSVRFLTYKRYEPYYDMNKAASFVDTTNSDAFFVQGLGFSPGQVYLINYAPCEEYQADAPFIRCAYEFEFRTPSSANLTALQKRYPFQRRVMDQGLRAQFVDPATGDNAMGNLWVGGSSAERSTRDVLLNGQGVPIDSTILVTANGYTPVTQTLPAQVQIDRTPIGVFLVYMDYAEQAFAGLNIV